MSNNTPHSAFSTSDAVAKYAEGPKRNVPGYSGLLPMTRILLAEHVPREGRVLVVGAGGGLEVEDLAQANPAWTIDGVDPSGPMLELAAQRLGPLMSRVALHEGYVQDAPAGPFDGATCLLTFHFVPRDQRLPTAKEIHRRLKPGAPFVMAHLSVEDGPGERETWMSRYAAFLVASGSDPRQAAATREKVEKELTILSPAQDEAMLRDAGFSDIRLFFTGFTFRGWVARA
ncbi:class I SAM-dependent methyltransferase [Variovorax sp. NFACC27]|uniref:class I SAM-dependent methyltransferase n=1 Tax=unclassified Variovorax TaxID=663243 RepID=UPI0008974568|nr:class I SAM-dependent methyltransferase [Variovorax sp. YR750]MDP9602297.1 tRNA (cmo5U34)-methyltransferase [Variovorax paradoxus]SEF31142.1 tRNA (cmo5U34)-methyltransferase [Variovorax sp. NFACC28]SEG90152.1 tRNA (cmo5U34)-methyltransferase [Variovorax sp. NFACC29]SFD37460.1 tRNA (cmo5U34)-methyltransferase [Variovorax sp. NFACC26]SFG40567.1 tRNA (cmo5U34)-methyltransferase [Variovorax sp. NFACC27]